MVSINIKGTLGWDSYVNQSTDYGSGKKEEGLGLWIMGLTSTPRGANRISQGE
jgi:hypothetical protein